MSSGDIPDSSITASSFNPHSDYDRLPQYARLGWNKFWLSARDDTNPWIQVNLSGMYRVTGLQTAGDSPLLDWVEQIKVQVGLSEESLMFIEDSNKQPKVCVMDCVCGCGCVGVGVWVEVCVWMCLIILLVNFDRW